MSAANSTSGVLAKLFAKVEYFPEKHKSF